LANASATAGESPLNGSNALSRRIADGATQNQLAALGGFPGQVEMRIAKLGAARQVVFADFVKEQVVHGRHQFLLRR
jgi:hypothetical protein